MRNLNCAKGILRYTKEIPSCCIKGFGGGGGTKCMISCRIKGIPWGTREILSRSIKRILCSCKTLCSVHYV